MVNEGQLQIGAHVTVLAHDTDPIEIILHRHAVITDVNPADTSAQGPTYLVGHPWASRRRYGPYSKERLIHGWKAP